MSAFLIVAFAAAVVAFSVAAEPTARNVRALKLGALAALLGLLASWAWPMRVAELLGGVLVLAALALAFNVLAWPLRFIGRLLRGR